MTTSHEPPIGWSTFGTHADVPVALEFSPERDQGGDPLWERPVEEDSVERMAEKMCQAVHPSRFDFAFATIGPCSEHMVAAKVAAQVVMTGPFGDALVAVLELHSPGRGYPSIRFEKGRGGALVRHKYIRHDCTGENAPDEYPVEWPCPTVQAIASAGIAVDVEPEGDQ